MPVLVFFSAVVNLMYYFGAIQYFILKISWILNTLMGTSPTESTNTAANIFFSMVCAFSKHLAFSFHVILLEIKTEAPLLIKPFLPMMTGMSITREP